CRQVDDEVLLERGYPIEGTAELVRFVGPERVRDERDRHELVAKGREVLSQRAPVVAGEKRVWAHRIAMRGPRDGALENRSAGSRQSPRDPEFREGLGVRGAGVTGATCQWTPI